MDTISQRYDAQAGPKYQAVAGAIRRAIAEGAMGPGERLPPVRELAWSLALTPGTVARAYTVLTDEGALLAEVGRGTFVAEARAAPAPGTWPRHSAPERTDLVDLYSPKVPDMGQVALLRDAFARMGAQTESLLNYPTRAAFAPARRAVLRFLKGTPLGPVDAEDMVLSHGGQNAISLVMQAVLQGPRPVVLVEELTYPGFRRAAELARAEVVGVPMDSEGVIPEALEALAREHNAQLFCTLPEVHNPTGLFTPLARRRALAAVAQRTGLHVLEDDCYRVGRSHEMSYRALLPEQGWYVSSLSKTLTPALRVGFAVAPKARRADLRRVAEYGFFGIARPLADLVEDLLSRDETYALMDRVHAELDRYVAAAVAELAGYPLVWRPDMPFLWLELPESWRAGAFCQAAEAQGVQIRGAEDFALRDGFAPHAVRIGVNAQVTLDSFAAAMARLRALLDHPPERIEV